MMCFVMCFMMCFVFSVLWYDYVSGYNDPEDYANARNASHFGYDIWSVLWYIWSFLWCDIWSVMWYMICFGCVWCFRMHLCSAESLVALLRTTCDIIRLGPESVTRYYINFTVLVYCNACTLLYFISVFYAFSWYLCFYDIFMCFYDVFMCFYDYTTFMSADIFVATYMCFRVFWYRRKDGTPVRMINVSKMTYDSNECLASVKNYLFPI